jgi:hypothetical protein
VHVHANCLDTRSRMTLTTALIQCYFDYSCSSWYSSLGKSMIKKLQVVQNKVARFVLDLGPRSRINCDILDKVNMLSVTDRVRQLRINHVFNIFHVRRVKLSCPRNRYFSQITLTNRLYLFNSAEYLTAIKTVACPVFFANNPH